MVLDNDFATGLPADYRTDLRTWILNGLAVSASSTTTVPRGMTFTVYGLDSNVVSAAIQYAVRITGVFGGTIISLPPSRL